MSLTKYALLWNDRINFPSIFWFLIAGKINYHELRLAYAYLFKDNEKYNTCLPLQLVEYMDAMDYFRDKYLTVSFTQGV